MNIFCVDTDRRRLMKLWRDVLKVIPRANVQTFSEMGEVVRYASGNCCDVLLTELNPGRAAWNGVDLAERIKTINPRVNVIFISPEPPERMEEAAGELEISGYIQRPYEEERLAEELTHLRYAAGESSGRNFAAGPSYLR